MCGIGGIICKGKAPDLEETARRLERALLHRGPDDHGLFVSKDRSAALVHTRLSVIDPSSAGHQPMRRGPLHLTFNGEIYNFRELRSELAASGECFQTETDTEVLLALYAREGAACLSHLRGMFAFAIWNDEEGSCFLARDRFGMKPLYYGFTSHGDLLFASEVKALLATGQLEARLDPAGLESYLTFGSVSEPRTLVASIHCLAAGHGLHWRHDGWTTKCYLPMEFQPREQSAKKACDRTGVALCDSVHHHLVSDVPVGLLLSGGLDSGALLAAAQASGHHDLSTFTLVVEDTRSDEADQARRLANFYGTRHHEMLLTRELAAHWVEPFLDALDQPTVDGFNTYCACKLARDHGCKVVLSGIGGDELFGGYPSFHQAPRLQQIARRLQPLHRLISPAARAWESLADTGRTRRLAAYLQEEATLSGAYRAVRSIFSPRERKQLRFALLGDLPFAPEAFSPDDSTVAESSGDVISRLELTLYLRNQLLRDADVMSMAHGVELRVPFLDHELLRTLHTIPSAIRLQTGKQLLRDAAPGLPRWHATEAKRGFSLPYDTWLESTWSDLKSNLAGAPPLPLDTWSRKWSLIVLLHWLRRHGFAGWSA